MAPEIRGCDCCMGDLALHYEDEHNNAFVDSSGNMLVTVGGKEMEFKVQCCPSCGNQF